MADDNVTSVYIAVFGRPADPAGLSWISNETKGGADFSKLGDITATPEYQSRFAKSPPVEIIKTLIRICSIECQMAKAWTIGRSSLRRKP